MVTQELLETEDQNLRSLLTRRSYRPFSTSFQQEQISLGERFGVSQSAKSSTSGRARKCPRARHPTKRTEAISSASKPAAVLLPLLHAATTEDATNVSSATMHTSITHFGGQQRLQRGGSNRQSSSFLQPQDF